MPIPAPLPAHLRQLEAESIAILRDAAGAFRAPVMLYSIGKDSSVMLHLALKAFRPGKLPFPLLHIATSWDFQDMIRHRDQVVAQHGLQLLVHTNTAALDAGASPLGTDTREYTRLMLTEALKQALDRHGFDAAFGGGRRDEERSRAKERVFSVRAPGHAWEPRDQRPELWNLFNTRLLPGQTMRVFPLSNWTELDIWNYIRLESVPLVPLYLARPRPVVRRRGALVVVDDARLPLLPDEVPEMRQVRFRTLGCYPLSGAIESTAATPDDIYRETLTATKSERQGRLIDGDEQAAMERKKREGYF